MTLGKLTSARAKALKGTSDYTIMVNGKKVVHVNPNHSEKTIELILEGQEPVNDNTKSNGSSGPAPQEKPEADLIDQEGNYVLF